MKYRTELNPNVFLAGCTRNPESLREIARYAIYGIVMAAILAGCTEVLLFI
jgi:hypothetical protein